MKEVNISETGVSLRTIRHFINSKGFWYLQAGKKGLLTAYERKSPCICHENACNLKIYIFSVENK